jgi:hypothetical protein
MIISMRHIPIIGRILHLSNVEVLGGGKHINNILPQGGFPVYKKKMTPYLAHPNFGDLLAPGIEILKDSDSFSGLTDVEIEKRN